MNKEIQERIPVISFLMMCEVVFYHCWAPEYVYELTGIAYGFNAFITSLITGIGELCMRWFFAVTGFLLFRGLTFQNLTRKLKTRFYSLFIPYILWCTIYIIKSFLQGRQQWSFYEIIAQTFFLRVWPPLSAFWYVYAVFLMALLSPLFLVFFRNQKVGAVFVLVWAIVATKTFHLRFIPYNGHYYFIGSMIRYSTAYIIGSFYGNMYREDNRAENLSSLKYLAIFVVAACLFDHAVPEFYVMMTGSVMPILMLFLMPIPSCLKNRKIYHLILLIYATHESIISLSLDRIYQILLSVPWIVPVSGLIGRVLCMVLVCIVNLLAYRVMHRFTPSILKLLTGGRTS